MASSASETQAPNRPLISYEARISGVPGDGNELWMVPEPWSIRWIAFSPIATGVTVCEDPTDPDSPQVPFQNPDGTYHPVANAFTYDYPVSSVNAFCMISREYEDMMAEACDCGAPIEDDMRAFDAPPPCDCIDSYMAPPAVKVLGTGLGGGVTILDYITTVAPYLERCRDDLVKVSENFGGSIEGKVCYVHPDFRNEIELDVVGHPECTRNSARDYFAQYAHFARVAIKAGKERKAKQQGVESDHSII